MLSEYLRKESLIQVPSIDWERGRDEEDQHQSVNDESEDREITYYPLRERREEKGDTALPLRTIPFYL